MRKGFQLTALAGALTFAMGSASAVPTFDYNGWTVAGGQIDASTSSMCDQAQGMSCSVVAQGDGFVQLNVTDAADAGTGTSYIMTIVTNQNASGTAGDATAGALEFFDVSFVKMKLTLGADGTQNESGIVGHQEIVDGAEFSSTTDINTGWAATGGANVVITQTLDDQGDVNFAGDDFGSEFVYRSVNDQNTGTRLGFEMAIDQTANLGTSAADASANDVQSFALREKQGTFLTAASTAATNIDANGDGTSISWNAQDDIKAIWIGQSINLGNTTGGQGAGALGSSFGYLSFDNVTTGDTQAVDSGFGFSTTESDSAWVWDNAFNVDPIEAGGAPIGQPTIRSIVQ